MLDRFRRVVDVYRSRGLASLVLRGAGAAAPHSIARRITLVRMELEEQPVSPPWRERLRLWRHGFLSQSAALYDFDTYGYDDYLSDYARLVRSQDLNGRFAIALDDKLLFHHLLHPFAEHLPTVYGLIEDGTFYRVDTATARSPEEVTTGPGRDPGEWLVERVRREGGVVLKPLRGGGGTDVLVCTYEDGEHQLDRESIAADDLAERARGLDGFLATSFVEQADYAEAIYPGTANTIRALTMYDEGRGEPFLAACFHRIATDRSGGVDNWSAGGLAAAIREDGTLGRAVQHPYGGELVRHDAHPDTGAAIEERRIPGWSSITDRLVSVAAAYPYVPYVGWDIVVTAPGEFEIIEANSFTDVHAMQVHEPLLRDDRVGRFYERHGVV